MRRVELSRVSLCGIELRDHGTGVIFAIWHQQASISESSEAIRFGSEKALLTARPDIRFLKLSFLAPAVVLVAGIVVYLLPLAIDRDFQLAGSAFMIGISLVGMACLLALYEGLSKAVYRLTDEHIEEEYGIIHKRVHRIPLSYVRDVTYDQNFLH